MFVTIPATPRPHNNRAVAVSFTVHTCTGQPSRRAGYQRTLPDRHLERGDSILGCGTWYAPVGDDRSAGKIE